MYDQMVEAARKKGQYSTFIYLFIYLFIMQIACHDKSMTWRVVQTVKTNLTQRQTKTNNV